MFSMMKKWASLAGLALLAMVAPAHAHEVKDPVCRMTVDSDTTKFKHKVGNKTFYFCSTQCENRFAKEPARYSQLAEQLEREDLHEYKVDFAPSGPAVAGKPVGMAFTIRYAGNNQLVRNYEVIHERLVHLLMVTEDLSWFEHQHPVRGKDGIFRLTWAFPRPGRYRLYVDFTPSDGDNQVIPVALNVGGGPHRDLPLRTDQAATKQVGNYRVTVKVQPGTVQTEKTAALTFTIRDRQGRPVRNMQPFIGAPGHLIAISRDGKQVVHTHSLQGAAQGEEGGIRITPEMVTERGPNFSFKLTLPTEGLYRVWGQFLHNNRVVTVPYTFRVAPLWAAEARPVRAASRRQPAAAQRAQGGTVKIDGGYSPASITVKAGRPVRLTFVRTEKSGCGDVVRIPALGVTRTLKPGQKTVVAFVPKKPGTYAFTCGMNMYQGRVIVK